ncbi:uncharacterized protein FOMMEDRAFT_141236 [Fomitiporia mediterranea MF3/22]|uniref:uncharacterized protein n=1 Tax=Fomitiporia mediterranea (strain MF3/22) TaxID=694068 RepID=UPI00044087E9|nr:uncharacterized protein FOMMEDRAFT_141236 [Fomitiporia mediterranea MF3/22]EJD02059.1 hypothetical protein FOMMEDRAFT_141236 [Fomitiporia mediterranea MF3/22]
MMFFQRWMVFHAIVLTKSNRVSHRVRTGKGLVAHDERVLAGLVEHMLWAPERLFQGTRQMETVAVLDRTKHHQVQTFANKVVRAVDTQDVQILEAVVNMVEIQVLALAIDTVVFQRLMLAVLAVGR